MVATFEKLYTDLFLGSLLWVSSNRGHWVSLNSAAIILSTINLSILSSLSLFLSMADPASSKPWHAIFAFLITVVAMVVQMHFPNSSPAEKYSPNVWIFIICLFLYGFSSAYYKSHSSTSNNDSPYFKLSSHIAAISGSMACAVLISVLVSKPVLALIIVLYLTWFLIYFSPNPVTRICKKIGSYMYEMCKGRERNHGPRDNLEV